MTQQRIPTERIAVLRHDLRTPVNQIVGYTEMLMEDVDGADPRSALFSDILNAAREVLDRINTALPPTGGTSDADLTALLESLVAPQRRILAAIATLGGGSTDAQFSDDLQKIADAALRLTRPTTLASLREAVGSDTAAPAVPRPPSAASPERASPDVHRVAAARVLVVDDDAGNRAVLERRLAREGHTVVQAEHGAAALALVAKTPFDLVLLDVLMPGIDGLDVLERLKGNPATHDIPVIMISALDDLSSVVRCIEFGAEDYLPKPFDPVLLRARIGAALEKKRLRDREADYLRAVAGVTDAAGAVERGEYQPDSLTTIARRDDEVGRLARVFDAMVAGVRAREARLQKQLQELQTDISIATVVSPQDDAGAGDDVWKPGSVIANRYEVAGVLGRGGMGLVYRANDRELGEEVAVKMLHIGTLAGDEGALERFKNEIRLARRISHRNVVRTHDLGESDGAYFVTMELVRGITVRELLATRGRLGVHSTLAVARQLVEALAVAHEAGIIHRDVKPENALLDGDGVLKVMDFGIARLAQASSNATMAGMVLGTPAYMSPEQLLGEEIDARADLYAVGVMMYECLAGVPPFSAPTAIALIGKVLTTSATPVQAVNAEVPQALSALTMRLLAKSRDERPRSARDLLEQLAELA
ncbi:MAG: protein kinase [Proteobacteria bacterium]|nr:protein kinase [Pseudomonadota bacterium]